MVGAAFNATFSVTIYKKLAENNIASLQSLLRQSRLIAFAFVLLTFVVVCICYVAIPIIFPAYSESLSYLILLSVGSLTHCIYLLYVNYIFYYKKTKVLMYITFSTSLFHAILSVIVAKYSLMYMATLNAISNIIIMLLTYIYSHKLIKKYYYND